MLPLLTPYILTQRDYRPYFVRQELTNNPQMLCAVYQYVDNKWYHSIQKETIGRGFDTARQAKRALDRCLKRRGCILLTEKQVAQYKLLL